MMSDLKAKVVAISSKPMAGELAKDRLEHQSLEHQSLDQQSGQTGSIQISYDAYGQILNYHTNFVKSHQPFTEVMPIDHMRRFLLGGVTAGALLLYGGRSAKAGPDVCGKVGGVYTCQGDQSAGITYDTTGVLTTLNVNSLTIDAGAIYARENGDFTVNVDTGAFAINTTANGINAYSPAGNVTVNSTGDITSTNNLGIYAINSGAGEISVTNDGEIQSERQGIFAYSFAGKVTVDSTGDITSDAEQGINAVDSGAGGVSVTNNGEIQSEKQGIYAYSSASNVTVDSTGDITSDANRGIDAVNLGAGEISVTNEGNIQSEFQGIFAYSSAGKVTVDSAGDITSIADRGIYAKNSGAGEISVTNNGDIRSEDQGIDVYSTSGKVTVDSTGDITSDTVDAVFVESTGDLAVIIQGGTVSGFDDGIDFDGGANNSLINAGILHGMDNAIEGDIGDETVQNNGIVIGNVDLGGGTNAFLNNSTGTFRSGALINLGGGALTNAGNLTPGGINSVQTTTLTGDLVQTATGQFVVDIDEGGAGADIVTITGTANLAGMIAPNIINIIDPTQGKIKIADATGGVTLAGVSAIDTGTIDFDLLVEGNDLFLIWKSVINPVLSQVSRPLTPNQLSTAKGIEAILASGATPPELVDFLVKIVNLNSEAEILAALDQLHSESYLATLRTTLFSNLTFANSLFSCAQHETGANSHLKEGECYWARVSGRSFDQDHTNKNIGVDEQSMQFSGGLQFALQNNWFAGFAASYEDTQTDIDTRAKTDGYRAQFGGVLKSQFDSTTIALGLTGGFGSFDTKRYINFGGLNLVAKGDQDIRFGSGHLRVAHSFDMGAWYVKPMFSATATYLELDGLRESGAGVANLTLKDADDWYLSFSPAIEFGAEFTHASGATIRPYLRAGITYFENNDLAISTSFSEAPSSINAFRINTEFDDLFADLEVGVNIISQSGLSLKLNYEGHYGEDTTDHTGGIKLSVKF